MPAQSSRLRKSLTALVAVLGLLCVSPAVAEDTTTGGAEETAAETALNNGESMEVVIEGEGEVAATFEVPEGVGKLVVDLKMELGNLGLEVTGPDGTTESLAPPASGDATETDTTDDALTTAGAYQVSALDPEATLAEQLIVTVDQPAAGAWGIRVYSDSAEGDQGLLTASYTTVEPDNRAHNEGELSAGQSTLYSVQVPEGCNLFKAKLHTVLGSAVLATRHGAPPDAATHDCQAQSQHGNAQCIHHFPAGGTWYVLVTAEDDSLVTLQTHYTENQGSNPHGTPPGQAKRERDQDPDPDSDSVDQDDDSGLPPGLAKKDGDLPPGRGKKNR
jgi:hypothetical protein